MQAGKADKQPPTHATGECVTVRVQVKDATQQVAVADSTISADTVCKRHQTYTAALELS
jgi:hypothetical protein